MGMARAFLPSLILAFVLFSPFPVQTQEASDLQVDPTAVLLERRAIYAVPPVQPSWRSPALPAGSLPAEEIGSLEARRDPEIDYPREARVALREGTARVGFAIDETGRVTDCVIVSSSGDTYLDTGSCALVVARGLYRPARDAQGVAIRSGVTRDIAWTLAWDDVQPLTDRIVRLRYTIHDDGSFSDCWVDRGEGTPGVSHPEMCVGTWPAGYIAGVRLIAGPGDIHLESISGFATSEAAMLQQVATPDGWVRDTARAAWHRLGADGTAISCENVIVPGNASLPISRPCTVTTKRYAVPQDAASLADGARILLSYVTNIRAKPEGDR